MAKLTCHGGAGATTGANFLLEIGGKKVLIDCGMLQGVTEAKQVNAQKFSYDPTAVDYLFVTHAHIDHVGLIPKLVKEGFKGEIYSTPETKDIATLLMLDAAKINTHDREPIFSSRDVEESVSMWKTVPYHTPKEFGGFSLELYDAGHVLGSAMLKFSSNGKTMLFSGDIGNSPSPLLHDTEKMAGLDYLLMESVYGDRNHEEKSVRDEKFRRVVSESIARGGALLIPAFSLERTQVILSKLDDMFESGIIPSVPVYLDSPLAIHMTQIYERVLGHENFDFPQLKEIERVRDSQNIANVNGPKIILAGSGMSTAGRILYHEERYLPDPKSTILLAGYQATGTLGRLIKEGNKKVVIDGKQIDVRARVENIDGFSAHADSDALVNFAENSAKTLKKVFVAMGEPKSAIFLAQRLRDELELDAVVAEKGKSYEIDL